MKASNILLPLLGLLATSRATLVPTQRQVLVTYPDDTPVSILEEAKAAVIAAGGKITQEYSLIKSFAATVSAEVIEGISTLSQSHKPKVEDDSMVVIQQQEPIEQEPAPHTSALLEWVNTFTLTEDVGSLSELSDGHTIWDILRDVDPTYFTASLPESRSNASRKWIPRYENLKFLHKALASYTSEECLEALCVHCAGEGLQAIAKDGSPAEFAKLFHLVLQATIISPRHEDYIIRMASLTVDSRQLLKDLILNHEVSQDSNIQQIDNDHAQSAFPVDPELEFEERYGKLMAENERLLERRKEMQSELRDMNDRLIRLQDSYSMLQQKQEETDSRLHMNGSAHHQSRLVKDLEARLEQQENDIADQEARATKEARKVEALEKKINNLEVSSNASAKQAQAARDELDGVMKERDALAKKANMVEKLKQQLHASNGLKSENDTLRNELDQYRQENGTFDQLQRKNIEMGTTIRELERLLPRIEEDNAELVRSKEQLKIENESLHERCLLASKQHKQAQATIAQLTDRVRSSSVSSATSHDNDDLDGELTGLTDKQVKVAERTSSIEKQNQELQGIIAEQASKLLSLQRELNEANDRLKQINDSEQPDGAPSTSLDRPDSQTLRAQLNSENVKQEKVKSDVSGELKELQAENGRLQEINKQLESGKRGQQSQQPESNGHYVTVKDHALFTQEVKDFMATVKAGKPHDNSPPLPDYYADIIMREREMLMQAEQVIRQIPSHHSSLPEDVENIPFPMPGGRKSRIWGSKHKSVFGGVWDHSYRFPIN
ncbi:MAG: hypothetical protein Q9222_007287 [Ikaeria aurantiellina]